MNVTFNGAEFRHVLGHYPTGVCAVTAMDGGRPVAMVVGSFTSASLDPPLVAFLPDRKSRSWPRIARAGRFCVNVLAEDQQPVCRALASRDDDKFQDVAHRSSAQGLPIIDGAIAWIECALHAVHEAGDHFIALGRVQSLKVVHRGRPLLFFRGGYGSFAALGESGTVVP